MGENSKIQWTDHTMNFWIGCTEAGPECDHCYARTLAERYGWADWGPGKPRHRTSAENWRKPLAWDRKAAKLGIRYRVFSNSLSDFFDAEVPDAWRDDAMKVINATPNLDWLLLTKRPKVMRDYFRQRAAPGNVWAGTTIGTKAGLSRLRYLRAIPATVRFLSIEPLLEDLGEIDLTGIHWVIVGGESGKGWRPVDASAVRFLRDQCQAAGVAFHFKQWAGQNPKALGRLLDGREWNEVPTARLTPQQPPRHAGDMEEGRWSIDRLKSITRSSGRSIGARRAANGATTTCGSIGGEGARCRP